ncbi:MAG: peptidoglycan-binding protein, partial [Oceanospirillum sp.]|nr:peptidoglycan-binding protein [Oceanospirillum sp.]
GQSNRLVPGNVLTIRQNRAPVKDNRTDELIELPPEETGKLMVFRTFKQVSYALVMEAKKPVGVGDQLITPEF